MTVVLPVIHLNGTSTERLLDHLDDVYMKAMALSRALASAAPNQRDYYPIAGLWEEALRQHEERLGHVRSVIESIEQEVNGICEISSGRSQS